MASLLLMHYWRENQLIEDQIRLTALELGEAMIGSLRQDMLDGNCERVVATLADLGNMESIESVQIVGLDGRVKWSSPGEEAGKTHHIDELGCKECHQSPEQVPPRASKLSVSPRVLRVSTPIDNEPVCADCHDAQELHLGVLLADVPVIDVKKRLTSDIRREVLLTLGISAVMTIGVMLVLFREGQRRIALRDPLAQLASGDFTTRVSVPSGLTGEVDMIATVFNQMAEQLERRAREQEERHRWRERAIAEERGRIARELHDGMAQLLGYVNTKAMAARLMLGQNQGQAAKQQLLQLEEAARALLVDVREAILGLKMTGPHDAGLPAALEGFTRQWSRLSDLPVDLTIASRVESLSLTPEIELQLLRIIQESLTNVRKHASATNAWIDLLMDDGVLQLRIRDDGKGFDPAQASVNSQSHYGLTAMRERADSVGARFNLDSQPGAGTSVTVRLAVEDG
jgi:signal transduction histidine kinase